MCKLSIITINYNDAAGLRKTLDSVAVQTLCQLPSTIHPIEHIIVDGGSTDGSVNVIKDYLSQIVDRRLPIEVKWVSEPDNGIYNAMNKGIEIALGHRVAMHSSSAADRSEQSEDKTKGIEIALGHRVAMHSSSAADRSEQSEDKNRGMATGDYIQILNAGDILASNDVVARMSEAISHENAKRINASSDADKRLNVNKVDILYGNMIKRTPEGKILGKSGQVPYSLLNYFTGTMNHDCCWIRRDLFLPSTTIAHHRPSFGLYDENLRIVSDWKWFIQAIGLGWVRPVYADIDVTIFDTTGVSERNLELRNRERRQVLEEVLPPAILRDYDEFSFPIEQYRRLRKHHLWGIVYFVERVLFKLEKWGVLKKRQ